MKWAYSVTARISTVNISIHFWTISGFVFAYNIWEGFFFFFFIVAMFVHNKHVY